MTSRKRKAREENLHVTAGVDYSKVADRRVEDKRFERYKNQAAQASAASVPATAAQGRKSATYDAFMRMATGAEARTLRDQRDDPNRPNWETFKEQHKDKLELAGSQTKEMMAYRQELDAAREQMLADKAAKKKREKKRRRDEDETDESEDSDAAERKRSRKKEKKRRKKKKKKSKKRRREGEASDEEKGEGGEGPLRLSSFLNESSSDDE